MDESNLRSLLAETTSAEHEIVLTNQTTAVTTGTAIQINDYIRINLPATRTGTVFTRMRIIEARHII